MKKRILSFLLAGLMLMSLMSTAALAEEPVTAEIKMCIEDFFAGIFG